MKPARFLFIFVLCFYCGDSRIIDHAIGVLYEGNKEDGRKTLECGAEINNGRTGQTVFFHPYEKFLDRRDSFKSSKTICSLLQEETGVIAVFGPSSTTTTDLAQSICQLHTIPNIQFTWTPDPLGPNTATLNFYPHPKTLAIGLATVVKSMGWRSFVVLYEDDEGLVRLQEVLKLQNLTEVNEFNAIMLRQLGDEAVNNALFKEIKNSTEAQIVIDCHVDHVVGILRQASKFGMLDLFYSYFLTSLDAHTLDLSVLNARANITSWKIVDTSNGTEQEERKEQIRLESITAKCPIFEEPQKIRTNDALAIDALDLFMETVRGMDEIESNSFDCDTEEEKWLPGTELLNRLKQTKLETTLTGRLSFDENGNRVDFSLDIVDLSNNNNKKLIRLAVWNSERPYTLDITLSEIESMEEKLGSLSQMTFKVSSRIGAPYLDYANGTEGNDRYMGFSRDLMDHIAKMLNFTYELELTADGKYGNYDAEKKQWNGLIRDLLERKAHLAICDLTITHQRRSVVDFSSPFMSLGISILYKKGQKEEARMFAFLDPFSYDVWIYTVTLYLAISILLYFISRMAPGDWENPHPCNEKPEELENIWDLKNCLWLTLGSIMTQGCDILPKGISTRMASSMWWFFSLIMTSSYTANLAAFLTTVRMGPTIDSAEALAKQTKIKYGTVEGGATQAFFRESNFSTYQRMWTQMVSAKPSVFEKTNAEGVKRVQNEKNGLYAFLMESSSIEYEVERNCDLKQVGAWLDSKGYGIAMPFNFPYRTEFNSAILKMQEDGTINELKTKWWKTLNKKNEGCSDTSDDSEATSNELALANVGGVFLVLGVGTALALVFAAIEFLWNVHNISVEEHIPYWEAFKVEFRFAVNIFQTKKRAKPVLSESSSSAGSSKNGDTKSLAHSVLEGATSFLHLPVLEKVGQLKNNSE